MKLYTLAYTLLATCLSPLAQVAADEDIVRCDIEGYYHSRIGDTPDDWTREDLRDLVQTTHTQITPFYGPDAGNGDILEALLEMDAVSDGTYQYMRLFYLDRNVAQYPLDRSVWVPEHILPILYTSVGMENFNAAYSDLHNIRPVHPTLHESYRGTLFFGICPVCIDLVEEGSDACICGDFFQPPEHARGAVARAFLYMQLRYDDLNLSNCHLEQLLAWHELYPPEVEEKVRNLHICYEWQGNRNPFVDFPELAWRMDLHESECLGADFGNVVVDSDKEEQEGTENDVSDAESDVDNIFEVGDSEDIDPCQALGLGKTGLSDESGAVSLGCEFFPVEDENHQETEAPQEEEEKPAEDNESDNVFDTGDIEVDICASLQTGDVYFYVVQATPTRVGMLPLIELPQGLELYLSDTLSISSVFNPAANIRVANDYPDPPLLKLSLDRDLAKGNPFGYGENLLFGDEWEVVTGPIAVRGDAFGGDELFAFCVDKYDQIQLLSALTTHGEFQDSDSNDSLNRKGYGMIILSEPHDYYVYNGPHYTKNESYQLALMDPANWLGFEIEATSTDDELTTDPFYAELESKVPLSEISRSSRQCSLWAWLPLSCLIIVGTIIR